MRLTSLLRRAASDSSVMVVVITGMGDYFTSGADIRELQSSSAMEGEEEEAGFGKGVDRRQAAGHFTEKTPTINRPVGIFMVTLATFPKPVVAAVNGPAVGIGVTLLPHCDLVYAAGGSGGLEEAVTFWTPFFRLAIVPEFCSSVTFPEIMGWAMSNDVLLMGRKLTLAEARETGLVSRTLSSRGEAFLSEVCEALRKQMVQQAMGAESSQTFKRIMNKERLPRILRVLQYELTELDRRFKAGHPQAALRHMASLSQSREGGRNMEPQREGSRSESIGATEGSLRAPSRL
ncbi:unnamed protein product [Discosporangium mesarthrocarpum]